MRMCLETLIIGAGAAGLAAGRKLCAAGQSILLLEARERIGGRIWTDTTFADFPVEWGAELIHGEHAATHDLVRAANFHTLPAPRKPLLRWGTAGGARLVADLPPPLNDGMGFFQAALERKVICVPGEFFDVNPGKRRHGRMSRFRDYVRFSFGPSMATLDRALGRLEDLIRDAGQAAGR